MTKETKRPLSGKTILITGAAGHLGKIFVDTSAELGASLIILDRDGAQLDSIKSIVDARWNVACQVIECDLESESSRACAIRTVLNSHSGLYCLVNNAAFVGSTELEGWNCNFESQNLQTWRRALEVNVTTPFHFAQAFSSLLKSVPGSNIVNVSSIYARLGPDWSLYEGTKMGNPAAYGVSKAGLDQLTRWLATTMAPLVRVNSICPGGIFRNQPDSFVSRYEKRTPLLRMGSETDFRSVFAFLISDGASYVNAQNIVVDGGFSAW